MSLQNLCCLPKFVMKLNPMRHVHTEKTVQVFGKKINYVQNGEGKKTLLLMPGALGTAWTDFRPQIEELPKLLPNHSIIAWDPPGCGKSISFLEPEPCGFNMFETQANSAIDLLQVLNRDSCSVLGWNFGGTSALIMAGRFPQFIDKLVIWGTSASLTLHELKQLDKVRGSNSSKMLDDLGKSLKDFYGEKQFEKMWPSFISAMEKIVCEKNGNLCSTEVELIQAPTLVLHGGRDPIITYDHIEFLMRSIKNARYYEFPDGRHDIHLYEPTKFNKQVSKFILGKPETS